MAGSSSGRSAGKNSSHDEQMDEPLVDRLKGRWGRRRRKGEISVTENRDAKSRSQLALTLANRPGIIGLQVDLYYFSSFFCVIIKSAKISKDYKKF